jgi:hypothetical protein
MFNLFRKKPKEPIKVKKVTCSKHGLVNNFTIHIVGGKDYDVCWDCIGEFGSKYCTVEEIEVRGEK